ncbi:unnamed protein product [Rhizophagus irregularis]|uniref:Uncharacterized protein n=1 Tax=Rhizophagus irregularis TaxID=588596 RepID=A0A915YSZ2_9GLOM|nr:unnamed protein product [Rhizophagus irregularis]
MVLLVDKDDYNGNGYGRSPDHNKYDEFNKKITKEETSQMTKMENEDNKFSGIEGENNQSMIEGVSFGCCPNKERIRICKRPWG